MSADESSPRHTLLQMTNAFRASQAIYLAALPSVSPTCWRMVQGA
jgi:hypothetical protein